MSLKRPTLSIKKFSLTMFQIREADRHKNENQYAQHKQTIHTVRFSGEFSTVLQLVTLTQIIQEQQFLAKETYFSWMICVIIDYRGETSGLHLECWRFHF